MVVLWRYQSFIKVPHGNCTFGSAQTWSVDFYNTIVTTLLRKENIMAKRWEYNWQRYTPIPVEEKLNDMIMPGVGVQAASSEKFSHTVFGRDSLRVAYDTLTVRPDIAKLVIWSLARMQALDYESSIPAIDAWFGHILHEGRMREINGQSITGEPLEIYLHQKEKFGEVYPGLVVSYGTIDAPLDFITVVLRYTMLWEPEFLSQSFTHMSGKRMTYRESLTNAIHWAEERYYTSSDGLFESRRKNPHGQPWQFWRDGKISYLHETREVANGKGPIEPLEVQGKAIDAFEGLAEFFVFELPEKACEWRHIAHAIRQHTLDVFWMEDKEAFAMARDRDPRTGKPRLLGVISSTMGEVLETGLFEQIEEHNREKYITAIVKHLFSDKLLTPVGFRCLDNTLQQQFNHWFYHGPTMVWPMANNLTAIGLDRYGLYPLSIEVENRILYGVNMAGDVVEYIMVDPDGVSHFEFAERKACACKTICTTNHAQTQAWTASAKFRIISKREYTPHKESTGWRKTLSQEILDRVGKTEVINSVDDLVQRRLCTPTFVYDIQAGKTQEQAYFEQYGFGLIA